MTPSIEYNGYGFIEGPNGADSVLILSFKFKDGDGDIGLGQGDTMAPFNAIDSAGIPKNPYYFNLYLEYLEFYEGKFNYVLYPFREDTFNYRFRVQSLTPEGPHKAIRGDIAVTVEPSPFADAHDTVMYKILLYDRALHPSNKIETPPIVWKR